MATAETNVCVGSCDDDADVRKRRRANAYEDVLVVFPPPPPRQARTVARVDGGRGGAVRGLNPPVAHCE